MITRAVLRRIRAAPRPLSSGAVVRNFAAATTTTTTTTTSQAPQLPLNQADVQLRRGSTSCRARKRGPLFDLRRLFSQDEQIRNDLAYCLSFSTSTDDESDFGNNLNDRMKEQLEISKNQLRNYGAKNDGSSNAAAHTDDGPLPRTLEDAVRPNSKRAVVITEAAAPFRVFDVNAAWEKLCGYTHLESKGRTLGSLLGGPETDACAATAMINQLLHGESAGATLTNYKKDGRRFRNRLRCGPLVKAEDSSNTVTHFVGVLQEVPE